MLTMKLRNYQNARLERLEFIEFVFYLVTYTSYGPAKHSLSAGANIIRFILLTKTLFTMKNIRGDCCTLEHFLDFWFSV